MASSHRHHHHSCCSSGCCCSSSSHHPPPSQSHTTDPLLQTLITHLLQSQPPHFNTQYLKSQQQLLQQEQQQQQTQYLLQSLVRRITVLESSLTNISSPSPTPPPLSLREHAASIIQTRFRSFLARRSQSLRHLKQISAIKSKLGNLKSSLSRKTLIKPESLSRNITELLHELGSIQSRDSMILDAKRLVRGELVGFLEFVDGFFVKRSEISYKFAGTGRKSGGFVDAHEPCTSNLVSGNGNLVDQKALVEKLSRRVEALESFDKVFQNDEQAHLDLDGFHQISPGDEEENLKKNISTEINCGSNELFQGQIGYWNLLAPPPVQMECMGSDLLNKFEKNMERVVRH